MTVRNINTSSQQKNLTLGMPPSTQRKSFCASQVPIKKLIEQTESTQYNSHNEISCKYRTHIKGDKS